MDENAEDDLFREFEDSFFHMNSPMGRNDFTDEEHDRLPAAHSALWQVLLLRLLLLCQGTQGTP